MPIHYNAVFTDYLSVTYHPDDNPIDSISSLLCSCGYKVSRSKDNSTTKFFFPDDFQRGYAAITSRKNFIKFEFRGKCLSYLRDLLQFHQLIFLLSEHNHRVTKLDATMDVPRDFPLVLRGFTRKYPDSRIQYGRRYKTFNRMLEPRVSDGVLTGSIYIGDRRNNVSTLVYDKAHEMKKKYDITIPTTTRYEHKFRAQHCITLKDADNPTSLFWHYGGEVLLKRPKNVPEWVPHSDYYSWSYESSEKLPYTALVDSLTHSNDLAQWLVLADSIGLGGRDILKRELDKLIILKS